jgi:hypothetical protein
MVSIWLFVEIGDSLCREAYSTGMQLIRIKIRAMIFISTNIAMTTYCA